MKAASLAAIPPAYLEAELLLIVTLIRYNYENDFAMMAPPIDETLFKWNTDPTIVTFA